MERRPLLRKESSSATVFLFILACCGTASCIYGNSGAGDCDPLGALAGEDFDGDGILNGEDPDDDDDSVPDSMEHIIVNCVLQDFDRDGNPDGFDSDSDNDRVCDGLEAEMGTNPHDGDTDGDTHGDWEEIRLGLDPTSFADHPSEDMFEILRLPMRGWDASTCCSAYPQTVHVDLVASSGSPDAELLLEDMLSTYRGTGSLDYISSLAITEIIPPDGGNIDDSMTVSDLQEGSTVRLEITSGWPEGHDIVICQNYYLLDIGLTDGAGTPLSETVSLLVWVYFSFELDGHSPAHACGLFPECPPRDW